MSRVLPIVLLFAVVAGAPIDREKLEKIRRMTPEERTRLKERLEQVKLLPVAERERLHENLQRIKSMPAEEVKKLREKTRQLSSDERREFTELATGFFKWAHKRQVSEGFPRGLFFTWLKKERSGEMDRIRALEPGGSRTDAFIKLYADFRGTALDRAEQHVRKHRCAPAEEISTLRDTPPDVLWPRYQEIMRSCQVRK